jgi:uncharacterized lipoprotein YehR (DUF1307 family)
MNKFKVLFSVSLAFVLLFCAAACGKKDESGDGGELPGVQA